MKHETNNDEIDIALTDAEYNNMIDSLAFSVVYSIASKNIKEYVGSSLQEDVNLSIDIMSKLFGMPATKLDEDLSVAIGKVNREEAFLLAKEKNNNILH